MSKHIKGQQVSDPKIEAPMAKVRTVLRLFKLRDTIATRLIAVVIVTGVIGFGLIGTLTDARLQQQLDQQADALGKLSETQLGERLAAEAQLAKSRLNDLENNVAVQMRQIARRPDVIKAVGTENDVVIRETLRHISETSGIPRIIAFDASGLVNGANWNVDLLSFNMALSGTRIVAGLRVLLNDNSRTKTRGLAYSHRVSDELLKFAELEQRPTLAHVAAEPVFDDFGDVIGALVGIRPLALNEPTLDHFSSLANAGVLILQGKDILASAGPGGAFFDLTGTTGGQLVRSPHGKFVASCTRYAVETHVCTFTQSSALDQARDQMFRIGAKHGREQKEQFLGFAGLALLGMIIALMLSLRHIIRGLTPLANAARATAAGNLETPFNANGVGEIRSLGRAFEKMLANLRASTTQIRTLAYYDGVTQLPNREKMVLDAPKIIADSKNGSLLFLDLDGFKAVNDSFGHKSGDLLLSKVADRLSALLADGRYGREYLLSRLGGDEFAMLLPGVKDGRIASEVAERIIQSLKPPFALNGNTVNIGASIGIALYPESGTSYDQLLLHADLAMYAAKSSGRNTYAFFTAKLAADAQSRRALEADLIEAVRTEALSVYYQPKVLCANGKIRGLEALARWFHPERGPVSPGIFIPLAEQTGLIRDLGRIILRKALMEIRPLIDSGAEIVLSVNVTSTDIEDPKFARDIIRILSETGYPPERLELEITESIAASNATVVTERMNVLRQIGIRFSMDDFGAGYSNLATVARLPFDTIKIDRSLVHGVAIDMERQTILRAAIVLARDLGFDTVVEGVEEAADLKFSVESGATYVQGYIFSPPVSLEKIAAMIDPKNLTVHSMTPGVKLPKISKAVRTG